MIVEVNYDNIIDAAYIHAESWKESHRSFCSEEFVEAHTIKRQRTYLENEMRAGKQIYLLIRDIPVGIVAVKENLIENLYVLPNRQREGCGSELLGYAISKCTGTPALWILNNNAKAEKFYRKHGFIRTGQEKRLSGELAEVEMRMMDIWEQLYEKARVQYHPGDVTPFVYAHNVVCALESENGEIYTGFCIESCSGVMNLCAERVAALNMYVNSGQTVVKRMIAFRDKAPNGGGSGMPCGACREFFMQLARENRNMEIMVDYEKRETITLGELMPNWWGDERYEAAMQTDDSK